MAAAQRAHGSKAHTLRNYLFVLIGLILVGILFLRLNTMADQAVKARSAARFDTNAQYPINK